MVEGLPRGAASRGSFQTAELEHEAAGGEWHVVKHTEYYGKLREYSVNTRVVFESQIRMLDGIPTRGVAHCGRDANRIGMW